MGKCYYSEDEEKTKQPDYILNIELIPDGCWKENLRTMFPQKVWDVIRKQAYKEADGKCMICGRKVNRLEAHERWNYDEENGIQILKDVIAVCKNCHECIHIQRTTLIGREKEASEWFMKVNNCSYVDYLHCVGKANEDQKRRNKVSEWKVDLRYLQKYLQGENK